MCQCYKAYKKNSILTVDFISKSYYKWKKKGQLMKPLIVLCLFLCSPTFFAPLRHRQARDVCTLLF